MHADRPRADARGRGRRRTPCAASSTAWSSTPTASSWSPTTRPGCAIERHEQQRLAGVAFYSLLCEGLLGRRPARVQLLYLADPLAIITGAQRSLDAAPGARWGPSGRRSSEPASGRTSGPSPPGCATGARSRPTARPSAATRDAIDRALARTPSGRGGAAGWPRARPPGGQPSRGARSPLSDLARAIGRFDEAIDDARRPLPWAPALDRLMYAASDLGDWSPALAPDQQRAGAGPGSTPHDGRRRLRHPRRRVALVNGGSRACSNATGPLGAGAARARRPRSQRAFPVRACPCSTAAGVLSQGDPCGRSITRRGVVAASRVYVKMHHPSDVVGGRRHRSWGWPGSGASRLRPCGMPAGGVDP